MRRRRFAVILIVCLAVLIPRAACAEDEIGRGWHTLLDDAGRVLLRTGHRLTPRDVFITPDNSEYVVRQAVGTFAYARRSRQTVFAILGAQEEPPPPQEDEQEPPATNRVAIHHSHSDESYVPTDGQSSIRGDGTIYRVGRTLADALEQQGFEVDHSDDKHDPHDAGAYDRSRRTAAQQLRNRPAVVFDVHRDTSPPGVYETEIDGQPVSQVLIVVGRSNPGVQTNAMFARALKDAADEKHPGLVRGILFGRGKYNQDLHPRAILLEVGSHMSRREDAERAVTLLAEVVPDALGAPATVGPGGAASRSGAATAAVIVLLAALFGGTYLVVATGSVDEARRTLGRFVRRDIGLGGKDDKEGESDQPDDTNREHGGE